MLRYKRKTRPGLVALYDIRPGNRAVPFLQPRSPHGAARVGGIKRWCASVVSLSCTLGLVWEQRGLGSLKLAQR